MLCGFVNLLKKYRNVKLVHNISNIKYNQNITKIINSDHIHIEQYLTEGNITFGIKINNINIPILRKCPLQCEIVPAEKLPIDISKINKIMNNQSFVNIIWCGSFYPKSDNYIHFEFSSDQPYLIYIFSNDVKQLIMDNNHISDSIKMDKNINQISIIFIPLIKEGIRFVKDRNKKILCIVHFCEYIDQDISEKIIKNISEKMNTFHQNLIYHNYIKSDPVMIGLKK